MGVRHNELVQKLINITPMKSHNHVVQECYTFEAVLTTALAIALPAAVYATSLYEKGKNTTCKTAKPPATSVATYMGNNCA